MVKLTCKQNTVTKEQKKQERKENINELMKQEEEGALIYSKQSAFGFKLNTDGWGVFYEHGKYKTIKKTIFGGWNLVSAKATKKKRFQQARILAADLYLLAILTYLENKIIFII